MNDEPEDVVPVETVEAEATKEAIREISSGIKSSYAEIGAKKTIPGFAIGNWPVTNETFTFNKIVMEMVGYDAKVQKVHGLYTSIDNQNDTHELHYQWVDVTAIAVDELKKLSIFSSLPADLVAQLEQVKVNEQSVVEDRMNHARKFRQKKALYIGMPTEVTCCKCDEPQKMVPAQIIKRAEAKGMPWKEWIKIFACQRCVPTKGRRSNPKYANVPKTVHCCEPGCTFEQTQAPSQTEKLAISKNLTIEKYLASWKCKTHRPHKPHQFSKEGVALREAAALAAGTPIERRRGRPANPAFAGIPKTTICIVCKKEVTIVAQNILTKADILGITKEQLIADYHCKSCGGKITKDQKLAYKKRIKNEKKAAGK